MPIFTEKTLGGRTLIKVESRYLVTEVESLLSPAGYHPDTHIFEVPNIAIECDEAGLAKLKRNPPATNFGGLKVFDMRTVR